ncbi:MAG: hypothetical protein PF444_07475 [Bacteroidales bacterium]|nr:hypothetical protein [Bacteroidales bacterium]
MKKFSLITIISTLSLSLFAHPGHSHSDMSHGTLSGHIVWIIVPAIVFGIAFLVVKKRKSTKQ